MDPTRIRCKLKFSEIRSAQESSRNIVDHTLACFALSSVMLNPNDSAAAKSEIGDKYRPIWSQISGGIVGRATSILECFCLPWLSREHPEPTLIADTDCLGHNQIP